MECTGKAVRGLCPHGAVGALRSLVRLARLLTVAPGGAASIRVVVIMMAVIMRTRTTAGRSRPARWGRRPGRIPWWMHRLQLLGTIAVMVLVLSFVVKNAVDSRGTINVVQHIRDGGLSRLDVRHSQGMSSARAIMSTLLRRTRCKGRVVYFVEIVGFVMNVVVMMSGSVPRNRW